MLESLPDDVLNEILSATRRGDDVGSLARLASASTRMRSLVQALPSREQECCRARPTANEIERALLDTLSAWYVPGLLDGARVAAAPPVAGDPPLLTAIVIYSLRVALCLSLHIRVDNQAAPLPWTDETRPAFVVVREAFQLNIATRNAFRSEDVRIRIDEPLSRLTPRDIATRVLDYDGGVVWRPNSEFIRSVANRRPSWFLDTATYAALLFRRAATSPFCESLRFTPATPQMLSVVSARRVDERIVLSLRRMMDTNPTLRRCLLRQATYFVAALNGSFAAFAERVKARPYPDTASFARISNRIASITYGEMTHAFLIDFPLQ